MSRLIAIFHLLFLVWGITVSHGAKNPGTGLRCIVIDAGHGGKDPGAVGNGAQEKAINLAIALKLGKKIEKELPDVKVVYTRKDDRFIELSERSNIASRAGGDLFISIHTNAAANKQAHGTETFVMGVDKGNQNLAVVMRENSVISLEADYTSRYEGYDPNSAESVIMFSLMQYAYQGQSLNCAELIQRQYVSHAKRPNKGVKQAGFLVLWRTPMPSILTEVGFISNAEEAKFLVSESGQEKIAQSLLNAVAEYKKQVDGRTLATGPVSSGQTTDPTPVPALEDTPKTGNTGQTPAVTSGTTTTKTPKSTQPTVSGEVVFRIQVKSSLKKLPVTRSNFGNYTSKVVEKVIDGRYKYFCESSFSYKEALILQRKVRETFPDAFMVAFRNDKPVPLADVTK